MPKPNLSAFVKETAEKLGLPGVSVAVLVDGEEIYASHGVTSLDDPKPVDEHTLYQLGSVTKTYTATALMRLVAEGRVDLDAPVRRYVPELVLADEKAAAEITVLNLLNHTAGLDWAIIVDTGDGDDALAAYIPKLAEVPLIAPPNTRSSYSQAGYNLAGRIIETVTGLPYDRAIASLVFEPLGMPDSFYRPGDVFSRNFALGHNTDENGTLSGTVPWKSTRCEYPGGGLASSVSDQLRWARFHLGDGRAEDGARILPEEHLHRMKEQTVALRGSSLGDGIGVAWFLRDVDGVRTVGHGGSAHGQFAELLLVPERAFAVASAANAGPDAGLLFNHAVVRWALENYLGVVDRDPEPLPYDETRAAEVVGDYEVDAMTITIAAGETGLTLAARIKPELRDGSEGDFPPDYFPPDYEPAPMGLLPGDGDDYIVTGGGLSGQRGYFTRDENGVIVGADLAGRLFTRVR